MGLIGEAWSSAPSCWKRDRRHLWRRSGWSPRDTSGSGGGWQQQLFAAHDRRDRRAGASCACSRSIWSRGPIGEWRVLADRVRLPVGIGYALENRLAMSRATGGLLASSARGRRRSSTTRFARASPPIASGPIRDRFADAGAFQPVLSRTGAPCANLGFSLVEGRDLIVHDGSSSSARSRALSGSTALWRRLDSRQIDPLTFDTSRASACPIRLCGGAGPGPGQLAGRRRGQSRRCRRSCRDWRNRAGRAAQLPNVATWWCGGDAERRYVLHNLDKWSSVRRSAIR